MRQEDVMQRALESIDELVIFFSQDGTIFFANQSADKVLEYREGLSGHNIAEIFPGIFLDMADVAERIEESIGTSYEVDAYRSNRTCFHAETKFLELEDDGYICIASDLTEGAYLQRKIEQVQKEAEEAAKVKSEFVANITHELRTPVNGILGNILELKDIEDDPDKKKVLSLVERGCGDMNAIINNILDFSKLEAGKFTIENREFDFYDMVDYVESIHRPKITEKGLEFSISVAPDIPRRIIGDELRIKQILNNLLSNACKFTSMGRIAVEIVKAAQLSGRIELFFLVIDTGIGIKKENQDKLFQSFSQVDASISRRFGGTGLGLNICKQLVSLMDGTIHLESEEGKGSMFSFNIWVDVPEEKVNQTKDASASPKAEHRKFQPKFSDFSADGKLEALRTFGTEENISELERNLNKLILSVEMENWEKAETFANVMRGLTEEAPKEIKNNALRVKMAVQKEDYDKTALTVKTLRDLLEDRGVQ
ncbi:MAG: ATP-binding protein [Lachnospiraceae bacterium]|nr:ATP-binding protein [Lachnospiraceae bacterium]